MNISDLLAMGESQDLLDQSDEGEDQEDVKKEDDFNSNNPQPSSSGVSDNLEITVQVPDHLKKRKRKAFDFEAHLRRELSRSQRQTQVWMHQTHILCLLGHARYLSECLNGPLVQSVGLSLIPKAHVTEEPLLTPVKLSALVGWFRSAVGFAKFGAPPQDEFPKPWESRYKKGWMLGSNCFSH